MTLNSPNILGKNCKRLLKLAIMYQCELIVFCQVQLRKQGNRMNITRRDQMQGRRPALPSRARKGVM